MSFSDDVEANTKIIQFYRNFREFTGGHLKHWHYFNHVYYSASYLPYIYFGPNTIWDERTPWRHFQHCSVQGDDPPTQPLENPDVLFVEGVSDWPVVQVRYENWQHIPTINLIQHVRHADPDDPRYAFLTQRAVRLCVSEAVEVALKETKRVSGPLVTIPCGMELADLPAPLLKKQTEICIAALKNPEMGRRLRARLEQAGHEVILLEGRMGRSHFLEAVNEARVCVFLPWQTEGFYLPALEGMALDTLVICPDVRGNREFCRDGENCLSPAYTEDAIWTAIKRAMQMSEAALASMRQQGQETVRYYGLRAERRAFLEVLENLEQIW